MKVLIGTSSFGAVDKAPLERLANAGIQPVLNPYRRTMSADELHRLLTNDVVGAISGLETWDRQTLTTSGVKVVSRVGAGTSNIDLGAAADLGVLVYATPDAPSQAVAELTVGAMLNLLRHIAAMNDDLHRGNWSRPIGTQLSSRTVAVIGYGRIGRRVADLLRAFGAQVIAVGRADMLAAGATGAPLLVEALSQADIVSVHISGDECVLGPPAFEAMKDGALVLNAARGSCVDEAALMHALDSGKVAGAWLDVFGEEPYRGPLAGHPNVLLTPHAGSNTIECRVQMEEEAVDHLLEGLAKAGVL